MATIYEWDIERTTADQDIEHTHADALEEYSRADWAELNKQAGAELVLVMDHDGGRFWAYARNVGGVWMLPQYFEDAHGRTGASVPVRFQRELERARK